MTTRVLLARGEAIYADVKRRASGDFVANSTSWANVDTGLDITLTAQSGDKIEAALSSFWGGETVFGYLDVATVVAGSPVTYASSGTGTQAADGVMGWLSQANGSVSVVAGSVLLVLSGGDISSGQVTLRLRYKTATAANKTLGASANQPLQFHAKNLGPG